MLSYKLKHNSAVHINSTVLGGAGILSTIDDVAGGETDDSYLVNNIDDPVNKQLMRGLKAAIGAASRSRDGAGFLNATGTTGTIKSGVSFGGSTAGLIQDGAKIKSNKEKGKK